MINPLPAAGPAVRPAAMQAGANPLLLPDPVPTRPLRFFMRIISFNANGLRSAATKGFFDWFRAQDADVLCVQETKAQEHQLHVPELLPDGYQAFFKDAITKKGYSGVGIYTRRPPDDPDGM